MVSIADLADRAPRVIADGETVSLGRHAVQWFDTPHLPHAWECGFLMEPTTRTLLCGDLFTQPGAHAPALTEGDILGPSEAFRRELDYYSHTVFEWLTTELASQGAVCSGGRYDGLVAQLGGESTPGIGWAMGIDGIEPQAVLLGLDQAGIAAHSGSACSSEALEPSPVLEAMGVDAHRSLRVSVGWNTTDRDIERFLDELPRVVSKLRALAG